MYYFFAYILVPTLIWAQVSNLSSFLVFDDVNGYVTMSGQSNDSRRIYYSENIKSNGLQIAEFDFSVIPQEFLYITDYQETIQSQFEDCINK